ncbi:Triosephosphate isomerase [Ochromonadaceae sp. CCMP2298]|nr:Triosephosphate isomerase [Ochromonadaceae sp. CCMP2298]
MLAVLKLFLALVVAAAAFQPAVRPSVRSMSMIADGRIPLMGGNWKLNPTNRADCVTLAKGVADLTKGVTDVNIVVFPPHPFLTTVYDQIKDSTVALGGQNCYYENSGAYTGAVSTCMLKDVGVTYVLCGHSERRSLFQDDDGAINKKVKKVLKEGMTPVLCIGETQEEYQSSLNQEVCTIQLLKDLADITAEEMEKIVIAYEPVWAIGTGLVCPKEVAQDIHKYIRSVIAKKYGDATAKKIIIQYGGSVKPDNVKELMAMPDIDGALVGGASLTAESFAKIVRFSEQ